MQTQENIEKLINSIESLMKFKRTSHSKMYSLSGFREAHELKKGTWDILPEEFKPEMVEIGRRKFITQESASRWREKMTSLSVNERNTLRQYIRDKRESYSA